MAFQAVGWLSGKLGVDISGQQKTQQQTNPQQLQTAVGGFDGQQQQQYPPQQYPPQNGGQQFHDERQPQSVSNYYANQGQQFEGQPQGQQQPHQDQQPYGQQPQYHQPYGQQQPPPQQLGYAPTNSSQGCPAPPQQQFQTNGNGYSQQQQFESDQQQQQQQQQQSGLGAWGAKVGGWVNKEKLQSWAQKANQGMGNVGKLVFGDEGSTNNKVERDMFGNEIPPAIGHSGPASSGQPAPRLTGADDMRDADENGLPGTRNWYIFSPEQKRWVVSDDAPDDIKAEYYAKLEEAENERLGIKKYVPPPPPPPTGGGALPPPPQGSVMQGPPRLMYAQNEFFGSTTPTAPAPHNNGAFQQAPPPPPQQQQQQPMPTMAPVFFNPVAPQQPIVQAPQAHQQASYSPPPPPASMLPPAPSQATAAIHSNSTTALDHSQHSHGDEVGVPEAFVPAAPPASAPTMPPPPPTMSTMPPPPAPPSFPLPPFPQAPTF